MKVGVVEGFFGPAWAIDARRSYASFLQATGGDFYIYAPKQDSNLRKGWRENWSEEYLKGLSDLKKYFNQHQIEFGVGFSPFGLGVTLSDEDKDHLRVKLKILDSIGIDILGLFFDDMPTNPNLAKTQIEALEIIRASFKKHIIFCPSYYTFDPILDRVFGERPENYLDEIASGVPEDVSIVWTGPKVISPEIPEIHLAEVGKILKRKPFIWENLFANDGPRNCKFLKLRAFDGRTQGTLNQSEAFGFNMMNQAHLSKIVFLASKLTLEGKKAEEAFEEALATLCSLGTADFIRAHRKIFLEKGLDQILEEDKRKLISEIKIIDPFTLEIKDWLEGKYIVGSECLTD